MLKHFENTEKNHLKQDFKTDFLHGTLGAGISK
jgi:hypothetical protein